jgi:hypothetical protein
MNKRKVIINLTQHPATPEQISLGVVEPKRKSMIIRWLTFDEIPTIEEIRKHARQLAALAQWEYVDLIQEKKIPEDSDVRIMIGGAPFLMAPLEQVLCEIGLRVVYAFSKRVCEETPKPDGTVEKREIFKHAGFIEVS